tara:strand:+ start:2801 stop:3181 length:381 start_codon:yes stop_codon:yes gene_type:complete
MAIQGAIKRIQPAQADLEKIKRICYPCTKHNDCTRRLNNEQATVEKCNSAYNIFGIDPPPADFPAPTPQPKSGKKVAKGVSSTSGGSGPALMFAFLPILSYCSSCCLFFCCIFFVVKMAMKQPPSK